MPVSQYKVHFVYLVPSDKTNVAENAIRRAALHMQAWCRWQMGNGKTFTFTNPVVSVYQTEHDAEWYSTFLQEPNMPHSEIYWANAQLDARDYAGARFLMPDDTWIVYVDAPIAPDQHAGGASMNGSGIAVLHGKDVAATLGVDPDWNQCRAIGGGLHELLHTLGRPHPPVGPEFGRAVMGTGYMSYPNAILTADDKTALNVSRFFSVRGAQAPPGVCPFLMRPQRPPRPRPIPVPR